MKKLPLFLFFCLFFSVPCQADLSPVNGNAKAEPVIPKSYELEGEQWKAWQEMQQEWMKNEYLKILQEQKLRMNCSGCENIYMDAVFTIDAQGKLANYQLVNSKKCAEKFAPVLADRFAAWFFKVQFPPALHNLKFEVRLGTGLTC